MAANNFRPQAKINEIAEAIHNNGWHGLHVSPLAEALNGIGLKTSHGKPWTAAALRMPRRAALMALANAAGNDYQKNPDYGRF